MPRLTLEDQKQIRDLTAHLGTWVEGAEPASRGVIEPMRALLRAERSLSHGLTVRDGCCEVAFLHATAVEAGPRDMLREMFKDGPESPTHYNPGRPEPVQRNRVLAELTPAVRRRLWMERQLDTSRFALAALDEALSLLPCAAFVIDGEGEADVPCATRRWGLSERQRQVLRLLVEGDANKSIAANLQCTVSTVEQHVTAIFRKAGVSSRAELIVEVTRPR